MGSRAASDRDFYGFADQGALPPGPPTACRRCRKRCAAGVFCTALAEPWISSAIALPMPISEQIKLGSGAYGPSGSRAEPWPSFPLIPIGRRPLGPRVRLIPHQPLPQRVIILLRRNAVLASPVVSPRPL